MKDIKITFTPEEIDAAISLVVVYKSRVNILQEVYEEVVKTGKTALDEIHDILWQLVLSFDHTNNTFVCSPEHALDVKFLEKLMLKVKLIISLKVKKEKENLNDIMLIYH